MKVLTNKGYQSFSGIRKTIHKKYYEILFSNDVTIECTVDHIFESINGPITAKALNINIELESESGPCFVVSKKLIRRKFVAYDLLDVDNGNLYYTNGILSHNCSFLGSSNTLISSSKIQQLVHLEPLVEQQYLNIYEQPQKDRIYITTVDVGAGLGADYSVINVVDVTEAPYRQVLVYRNNNIDPTSFAIVVYSTAKKYNYSTLIVESNNDGKIVVKELWEMEYENLISTSADKGDNVIKKGRRSQLGIMMTKSTKKIGCSKLKELIETNTLIIVDSNTVSELSTFVSSKGSYEAESGKHDDIVMCLVMFAWFASTSYFVDISNNNTTSIIKENRDDEDIHSLLGFINDGFAEESTGFFL